MARSNFNKTDVDGIIAAAARNGSVVEFDFKNGVVTVRPTVSRPPEHIPTIDQIDAALDADRGTAKQVPRKQRRSRYNKELELEAQLGEDAYRARIIEQYRVWAEDFPNQPLGKLELNTLGQLAEHGIGVPVPVGELRKFGLAVEERLDFREFINIEVDPNDRDKILSISITPAGMRAWRRHASGEKQPPKPKGSPIRPRGWFKWGTDDSSG